MNPSIPPLYRWLLVVFVALVVSSRASARQDVRLDDGWLFKSGDVTNGWESSVDTQEWQAVSLPHSWGWAEAHLGKKYYRGPGWYRCSLKAVPQADQRYFCGLRQPVKWPTYT